MICLEDRSLGLLAVVGLVGNFFEGERERAAVVLDGEEDNWGEGGAQ